MVGSRLNEFQSEETEAARCGQQYLPVLSAKAASSAQDSFGEQVLQALEQKGRKC